MRIVNPRRGVVACLLGLVSAWTHGQSTTAVTPTPGVSGLPTLTAQEAFTVAPDGQLIRATRAPSVRLQSEVLDKQESVADLLSRHNLANDAKTREMLRAMNPQFDISKGTVAKGSKVDIFTVIPEGSTANRAAKYTFDGSNLTKFAFLTQSQQSSELSKAALRIPPGVFEDSNLAKIHVRNTQDIQRAAEVLESRADKLSKLDVAVAQFQIDYANRQADLVNARAAKGHVSRAEALASQASAKKAIDTVGRVEAGMPAADLQRVRVNVYKGQTTQHVRPLQVYVVPSAAFERPGLWPIREVESWIITFSFSNDASPVEQAIPRNFDPRICVGPKNSAAGIAKLIAANKLSSCRKPEMSGGAEASVLTFRSPQDVANP